MTDRDQDILGTATELRQLANTLDQVAGEEFDVRGVAESLRDFADDLDETWPVPEYGTMDREAIWVEAVGVLTEHFERRHYTVHHNSGEQLLHVIDRADTPENAGLPSRLTQIGHTTYWELRWARK